jgi:S1-C subfamily serine protease
MTASPEKFGALTALSNDFADAVERAGQAVVAVNGRRRMTSSGIHWRSGIIVTAEHTLKRDEEISVILPDDRTVAATLAGRDAGTDLAVLKLETAELPTVELSEAASVKVGHLVLAVARSEESGLNASLGVISAVSGSWRSWQGGQIDQFIRPDLTLYPGASGSALVDVQGRVIGINTAGPRNMALTIPASTVNRVVDQLLQRGRIARGYLGVGLQSVSFPEHLKTALNLSKRGGVVVLSIEPGSPADQSGLLIGDVLVSLDNHATEDVRDVHALLDPDRVGTALTAQIVRGGVIVELPITVGERSAQAR